MNYEQYAELQNRIEWLYDFHPEYFEQLNENEVSCLHTGLLYDVDDTEYPESIKDFYGTFVSHDEELQSNMVSAAQKLYALSGSGEFKLEK